MSYNTDSKFDTLDTLMLDLRDEMKRLESDLKNTIKDRDEEIGASCIHTEKDGRIFLDELDPNRGNILKEIMDECGIYCEAMAI